MSSRKLTFMVGQYVLSPVSYNSSGEVNIDTPFIEEAQNQKGNPRQVLRAYFNPNFLGSPVFRRVDESQTRGLRVFIPKVSTEWTVVQIKSVSEKASYGKPVNLEKGLLISYAVKCRELYSKALQFIEEVKTIKVQNLELPSFEQWIQNKEGYISSYEREKKSTSEILVKASRLEIKELKNRMFSITDKHSKHINNIKRKAELLYSDIKALEIKDEEVENDYEKLLKAIDNKG